MKRERENVAERERERVGFLLFSGKADLTSKKKEKEERGEKECGWLCEEGRERPRNQEGEKKGRKAIKARGEMGITSTFHATNTTRKFLLPPLVERECDGKLYQT